MNTIQGNLLITCCFSLLFASCGEGNDKPEVPKKIEVTGSAEMEVTPDEIYMSFTLKEYLDASKKKVKLDQIKANFLTLCKEQGVPDSSITVSRYSGYERRDYYWYKRRKSEPDFMASISYTVKANSTDILDAIVAGLNEKAVDNFTITKTEYSDIVKLRQEVKTMALIAAKAKAEYLAKGIGEEVGEALLIQEIENGYVSDNINKRLSNSIGIVSEDNMENSTPSYEKIKIRYEMRADFKLK